MFWYTPYQGLVIGRQDPMQRLLPFDNPPREQNKAMAPSSTMYAHAAPPPRVQKRTLPAPVAQAINQDLADQPTETPVPLPSLRLRRSLCLLACDGRLLAHDLPLLKRHHRPHHLLLLGLRRRRLDTTCKRRLLLQTHQLLQTYRRLLKTHRRLLQNTSARQSKSTQAVASLPPAFLRNAGLRRPAVPTHNDLIVLHGDTFLPRLRAQGNVWPTRRNVLACVWAPAVDTIRAKCLFCWALGQLDDAHAAGDCTVLVLEEKDKMWKKWAKLEGICWNYSVPHHKDGWHPDGKPEDCRDAHILLPAVYAYVTHPPADLPLTAVTFLPATIFPNGALDAHMFGHWAHMHFADHRPMLNLPILSLWLLKKCHHRRKYLFLLTIMDLCTTIDTFIALHRTLTTQLGTPNLQPSSPEAAAIMRLKDSGIPLVPRKQRKGEMKSAKKAKKGTNKARLYLEDTPPKIKADLDQVADTRIQALLPDKLPPPISPQELVDLVLHPTALAMPEEEDTFVLQMTRGFAAPERTWMSILTTADLHSTQKVTIKTVTDNAANEVPGKPVPLVTAESVHTTRANLYAAERILLCETLCTQTAWQQLNNIKREFTTTSSRHADPRGEHWDLMNDFLRNDREPLSRARAQVFHFARVAQFGLAAIIHPGASLDSLGRRTPTLSRVSKRIHRALANCPELPSEIKARADANLDVIREFLRGIVVAENKDPVREYLTDFLRHVSLYEY
ncbi:hypothetical protein B0H14DRAFT_3135099 [Mycena olivaceomarginata]|nr:hypothetical protein B0H14DRAFT_3135099 [Mycena olivaceomarginata]